MKLLDSHIARSYLLGSLPVLLLLAGLFSFLSLSEQLEDVGKGGFTTWAAIEVVFYTLPKKLMSVLPVISLLGVLTGLGALANNREIIAIRAAGMSTLRLARPLLMGALLLIAIAWLVQTFGIPNWERKALHLRSSVMQTELEGGNHTEFWTRTGGRLLRVGEVVMGRIPTDLEIYELDDKDRLIGLLRAERADIVNREEWLLYNVSESEVGQLTATTTIEDRRIWRSFLSENQLENLIQPAESLSPGDLLRYIHNLENNKLNSHPFRLAFWQLAGIPLGMIAMALLGLPFVTGSLRSVSISQRIAIGGAIGMVFYLSEQIVGHLAGVYDLNPVMAALSPESILLVIALRRIQRSC